MNRRVLQLPIAVAAVGLAAFVIALGVNLLPDWLSASRKGVTPQLILTWLMIGGTCVTAVILAVFLIVSSRTPRVR